MVIEKIVREDEVVTEDVDAKDVERRNDGDKGMI